LASLSISPDRDTTYIGALPSYNMAQSALARTFLRTAQIASSATLMRGCVVLEGATIGRGAVIGPNAVIGRNCIIGEAVEIGANASIANCRIGANSILHSGTCVGQDGFGFILAEEGGDSDVDGHVKKAQTLGVIIGDNVEIGANTCIDRGSWRDTVIGNGVKIDNLVQIGHNVIIGDHSVIAAACGIGGSVSIGERSLIGAMSGILQHTMIGSRAKIAARSGVMNDVPSDVTYGGNPAVPIRHFHRQTVTLRSISKRSISASKDKVKSDS
jgi:UDP-3-O-[3-hydroxymyristoyl] glucosamine N-acyltransferase